MFWRLPLLLFVLTAGYGSLGQDLRYLRYQSWSTEDGLPQDSVSQIAQTSDGFLWVATEAGIARFDGVSFRTFNHTNEAAFTSDDTCCLATGDDNALWIGTADGLLLLQRGRFQRFAEKDGLPSATIRELVKHADGSLFALTAAGWAERRRDGFVRVATPPAAAAPIPNATQAAAWNFSPTAVTVQDHGLIRQWSVGKDLPGSRIETLFADRQGSAWVGTNKGLVFLNPHSAGVTTIAALQGNVVLQVLEDREGNEWIATETSGLHVLRPVKFRSESGLALQEVTAVVGGGSESVWIGTRREGLRLLHGGAVTMPATAEKLTSPFILSLAPDAHGGVWAGTPDGLNHVGVSGSVEQITSANGLPDDYIQTLVSDGREGVWAGTRRGLVHIKGSQTEVFSKAEGLAGDLVGSLLQTSSGEVWIGTSGGLSRRKPDGHFVTYAASAASPATGQGIVTAMAEDPGGGLWFSSGDSTLSHFARGSFSTFRQSLNLGQIDGLAIDRRGFLWLRHRNGIDRVATAELERCMGAAPPCSPRIAHYGLADGLSSLEVVPGTNPALWTMNNGELWFATRRGVAIADPEHFAQNTVPPPVAIERFLADEEVLPTDTDPLQVPFGPVRFTIEYAALSFTVPSEVRYRYKLEGLDADWTDAGTRRSATYTNLRPRPYKFRVQAMNNDGVWNDAGATFRFRIVPPFYRRWWFLALMVLCLAAIVAGLYRLRLRSLQSRFDAVLRERNRMAREIHDTLAQDFVGVSLQLDIIAQLLGLKKTEAAAEQVQQTRKLVTEGLAEARRSIWELRGNLAQDSLPTRLAQVVERYSGDRLKVQLKIGGAYRKLDDKLEAEVLRIAQEALSNVGRHSGAAEASVDLQYGSDMLMLTVRDAGKGFVLEDALKTGDRFGVRGMQERAAAVRASLTIDSGVGSGTAVTLSSRIASAEK